MNIRTLLMAGGWLLPMGLSYGNVPYHQKYDKVVSQQTPVKGVVIGQALDDINKLRTTRTREALYNNAPGRPITSLDEKTLYNETGYEMYWEMYRRKAAIRFGRFDAAGTAKPQSQPYRRIYPIPQSTMDASKIFTQNPNY
ncbi:hypothetical protein SAMN05660909_05215 [Chitinophaga terrae (ex Kim and Jung 2007)]|uniref:RagB/SusD family nutrient uptake outer membrane protein n=1 Tax=Chitinophaga terrae (ex Kim and Jung 2007) TaxID=408074 RepID=A0A1H4GF36_9BACT|nr:hypothetical protein [Chitinophaga terrae (ex Kim and Jung 2007)]SEB07630.1 hypothetical protein SAMN05660909_05215 [Chitinophaga terrae (ex Kim and Jung 2007)]